MPNIVLRDLWTCSLQLLSHLNKQA